jgi:phage protein D
VPGLSFMLQIGFAPAPPEVVDAVEEIVVESALESSSAFRVRLGIAQNDLGDWRFLQEDLFQPLLPLTIRVAVGELPVPEALINGYVSKQEVDYADEAGSSTVEINGLDATSLMNLEEKVTPWPNLPDSTIAAAILGQYGLVPMVEQTSPTLTEPEGTTIQRGTDLRFVRRLAKRNGFDFYVQPEPLSGVDQGVFRPRQLFGAPQAVMNVSMGASETNVSGVRVRYDMLRPTSVQASTLDASAKSTQPVVAATSTRPPMGSEPTLSRIQPLPVVRPADTGLMRSADLQALAQGITDASSFAVAIEGQMGPDAGVLRPGVLVAVRGLGRLFNGLYLLTRVTHRIDDNGYVQQFEAQRNAATMTGAEPFVELF